MFKILENNNIIDLIKWFTGSVALVIVSLVIESGFKERETGIEEMKLYNQYVDIILKADNIEERWRLVEYYSIVTPTERLRERWVDYRETLRDDYLKYKELSKAEKVILSDITNGNLDSLVLIQEEKKVVGGSLVKKNDIVMAREYEELGFESLLKRDINNAINYFKMSDTYSPSYHNVYEIYIYLLKKRSILENGVDADWKLVYSDILNKYSWKMPSEYVKSFKKAVYL